MSTGNHRTCEICGVKERHTRDTLFFACFPQDENRCKEWIRRVGKEDLVHVPIEKINALKHVCGKHFKQKDFTKQKRLKKRAIPELHLMAPPLSENQLIGFPLHVAHSIHKRASRLSEPSTSKKEDIPTVHQVTASRLSEPSTSKKEDIPTVHKVTASRLSEPSTSKKEDIPTVHKVTAINPRKQYTKGPIADHNYSLVEQNVALDSGYDITKLHLADHDYAKTQSESASRLSEPSTSKKEDIPTVHKVTASRLSEPSTSKKEDIPTVHKVTEQTPKKAMKRKLDNISTDVTPRKKKLLIQLRKTKLTLASLKKSTKLIDSLESETLKEIVTLALQNQKRKPTGRRWTSKNKISALAIFKRSAKAYRYLRHLMPLPSVKTLQNVLKEIPMEPGINKAVLEHLKETAPKKKMGDKYCGLVFDEIALKKRLIYNQATDKVEGFVDFGTATACGAESGRSPDIADHALVFMLQGIRSKFKQPIAFYFVHGTVSTKKLATLIQDIIRAVEETGYHVLTTICDQGPTNIGAINLLKQSQDCNVNHFMVDDKKYFIIYDVPHLFKSIRNNFYNHGEVVFDGKKAKWEHILKAEEKNRSFLYLSKITQAHVQPKFRNKMKVKYAAQILSTTVSAVLKLIAEAEKDPITANEIKETAEVIYELDKLFNYTNGPSCQDDVIKGRRQNVSEKTDHLNVWTNFRKKIKNTKFLKANGEEAKNVKCLQGYITTLGSLQDIWNHLYCLGFKYLNLRQLNQDALENLFGIIRQNSPTNRNPTCSHFVAALKTAIVTGLTAPHNNGSNCEKDYQSLLTDFHNLIFEKPQNMSQTQNAENLSQDEEDNVAASNGIEHELNIPVLSLPDDVVDFELETELSELEEQPIVYVSGYLASVILKKHSCSHCKAILSAEDCKDDDPNYSYIRLREWWDTKKSLTYPSLHLCRMVEKAVNAFKVNIIPCLHYDDILKLCITIFLTTCDTSFFLCAEHSHVLNKIFVLLGRLLIYRQCKIINQNISSQEEASANSNKIAQQTGTAK